MLWSLFTVLLIVSIDYAVCEDMTKMSTYELRRPVKYFFRKLYLKAGWTFYYIDINPLLAKFATPATGHTECSSKLGPYCTFINGRSLKEVRPYGQTEYNNRVYQAMKASIKVEAQLITQLEKEGSHSNFVSGPLRLEYDEIISELLVDDMSEERTYKNGKPTIVPIYYKQKKVKWPK